MKDQPRNLNPLCEDESPEQDQTKEDQGQSTTQAKPDDQAPFGGQAPFGDPAQSGDPAQPQDQPQPGDTANGGNKAPASLNISIRDGAQQILHFKVKHTTKLSKVTKVFCEQTGANPQQKRFLFDGMPVNANDTPQTVSRQNLLNALNLSNAYLVGDDRRRCVRLRPRASRWFRYADEIHIQPPKRGQRPW